MLGVLTKKSPFAGIIPQDTVFAGRIIQGIQRFKALKGYDAYIFKQFILFEPGAGLLSTEIRYWSPIEGVSQPYALTYASELPPPLEQVI